MYRRVASVYSDIDDSYLSYPDTRPWIVLCSIVANVLSVFFLIESTNLFRLSAFSSPVDSFF